MKKAIIIAATALLAICGTVSAQDHKHEISVGYGIGTHNSISEVVGSALSSAVIGGIISSDNYSFTGAISVEYNYRLGNTFGVGAIVAYEHSKSDALVAGAKIGNAKDSYWTIMPAVKANWISGSMFRLYSKVAAGVTFDCQKCSYDDTTIEKSSDTNTQFAFQVSPVGIEVGKGICGYAELGYGMQGIGQVGIRVRF